MSLNPQLGFNELASAQSQPEVVVNFGDRIISKVLGGQIDINFSTDADYSLVATAVASPQPGVDGNDEWLYSVIRFTDTSSPQVLTGARSVFYPAVDAITGGSSRLMHLIVNDTGQDLTIRRNGSPLPTGVTVSAGNQALVWHNGDDIVAVVNPLP